MYYICSKWLYLCTIYYILWHMINPLKAKNIIALYILLWKDLQGILLSEKSVCGTML